MANNYKKGAKTNNKNANAKRKTTYVNKTIALGCSDFYDQALSDVLNLLDSIPFNKVSIPVSMKRSLLNGDDNKGFITVGNVQKFVGTNFTVSVTEAAANKITDEHVIIVRCRKDHETGEITYISAIYIDEGTPADDSYKDLCDAEEEAVEEEPKAEISE